jgi:hypothetical protein
MFAETEKLKRLAELNFCKDCFSKYLTLIHGEIEWLLSDPVSDWKQTEANINILWIKAKGFYNIVNSTVFSPCKDAFEKAEKEKFWKKLKFLKDNKMIGNSTYEFLDMVSKRRNKIHPSVVRSSEFSEEDYFLFQRAKSLTDALFLPVIHDLRTEIWKKHRANIEKYAKQMLEKTKSF